MELVRDQAGSGTVVHCAHFQKCPSAVECRERCFYVPRRPPAKSNGRPSSGKGTHAEPGNGQTTLRHSYQPLSFGSSICNGLLSTVELVTTGCDSLIMPTYYAHALLDSLDSRLPLTSASTERGHLLHIGYLSRSLGAFESQQSSEREGL